MVVLSKNPLKEIGMFDMIQITTREPALIRALLRVLWLPCAKNPDTRDQNQKMMDVLSKNYDFSDLLIAVLDPGSGPAKGRKPAQGINVHGHHGFMIMKPQPDDLWQLTFEFFEYGSEEDCLQIFASLFATGEANDLEIKVKYHSTDKKWQTMSLLEILQTLVAKIAEKLQAKGCLAGG